jgi:uncharacterized protein YbaR (Trm112 family)
VQRAYQPRTAEASVLHCVIRAHLDDSLHEAARRGDGMGLPAFADGTTHLVFEPLEFLEKLAALTPRRGINLVIYHGVLAPHSRWRALVIAYRGAGTDSTDDTALPEVTGDKAAAGKPRYWTWAALMRRAFDLDVLACPRCGGRLQLIATVEAPEIVRKILAHLGLLLSPDSPRPAPPGSWGVADAGP